VQPTLPGGPSPPAQATAGDPWSAGPEPAHPPSRIDLLGLVATARERARKQVEDAHLVRIEAIGVHPDGRVDDSAVYEFEGKRKPHCAVQVLFRDGAVLDIPATSGACTSLPLELHCSVSEAWRRAGAPAGSAKVIVSNNQWIVVPDHGRAYVANDRCGEAVGGSPSPVPVQPPRSASPHVDAGVPAPPRNSSSACDPFATLHGCPDAR